MQRNATVSRKRPGGARARALHGLLAGQTVAAAARSAGVNPSTVFRWLKDSGFSEALEAGRKAVFADSLGRLKVSAAASIDRLSAIVAGKDTGEARKAASTLLGLALKAHELIEVDEKIAELERIVGAAAPPSKAGPEGL
jgi:transposase-like protein